MTPLKIIFFLSSLFVTITGKIIPCYYRNWAAFDSDHGQVTIENLDPSLCTNIIYSFAGLDVQNHVIKSLEPYLDLPDNGGRGYYLKATQLKNSHPGLKVTLAIGGWSEGSASYSDLANNPSWRAIFVSSVVDFLSRYHFDGLDLDWEFPTGREGSRPSDREAFTALAKELKDALAPRGLILTAALTTDPFMVNKAYDIPALANILDFFHVMSYDYHNSREGYTGANTPLHGNPSLERSIDQYINSGAPPNKLIFGLPIYGLTYILTDANQAYMGAPAQTGDSFKGPDGIMGYNEICNEIKNGGWRMEYDTNTATAFAVNGNKFISYDDQRSVKEKIAYARSRGIAGIMVWSVDMDDVYNDCGEGAFPIMHAINSALD